MKWDNKNKERLYRLLYDYFGRTIKAETINPSLDKSIRNKFVRKFGIKVYWSPYDDKWRPIARTECRKYVHISDPWPGTRTRNNKKDQLLFSFFKIPKDIAEKFLILGVP